MKHVLNFSDIRRRFKAIFRNRVITASLLPLVRVNWAMPNVCKKIGRMLVSLGRVYGEMMNNPRYEYHSLYSG